MHMRLVLSELWLLPLHMHSPYTKSRNDTKKVTTQKHRHFCGRTTYNNGADICEITIDRAAFNQSTVTNNRRCDPGFGEYTAALGTINHSAITRMHMWS